MKREWDDEVVEMPFEDTRFYAPAGWDELLTQLYGDYMSFRRRKNRFRNIPIWRSKFMTKLLSVCIGIQRGAGAKRILCRDREDPEKAAGKLGL